MLTTQFLPGSLCWIELDSFNIEIAKRFYGGLFGWEFQDQVPEYTFCQVGGRNIAGIGVLMGKAVTSAWIPYFWWRTARPPPAPSSRRAAPSCCSRWSWRPMG